MTYVIHHLCLLPPDGLQLDRKIDCPVLQDGLPKIRKYSGKLDWFSCSFLCKRRPGCPGVSILLMIAINPRHSWSSTLWMCFSGLSTRFMAVSCSVLPHSQHRLVIYHKWSSLPPLSYRSLSPTDFINHTSIFHPTDFQMVVRTCITIGSVLGLKWQFL